MPDDHGDRGVDANGSIDSHDDSSYSRKPLDIEMSDYSTYRGMTTTGTTETTGPDG